MKRPKKGDQLRNRKSNAIVEVEGFVRGSGELRIKLKNVKTGRKSEPKLSNVKKQYVKVEDVESPTEPRPVVPAPPLDLPDESVQVEPDEALSVEPFDLELLEDEDDPDDPDEVDYAEPVVTPELVEDTPSWAITAIVFTTGVVTGGVAGVLIEYAVTR